MENFKELLDYDATLIKQDGTQEEYTGEGLKPMQEAVGGYVEGFYIDGLRAYCNEEGLYRGDLKPNALLLKFNAFIKGNVVVFKSPEAESKHFN